MGVRGKRWEGLGGAADTPWLWGARGEEWRDRWSGAGMQEWKEG